MPRLWLPGGNSRGSFLKSTFPDFDAAAATTTRDDTADDFHISLSKDPADVTPSVATAMNILRSETNDPTVSTVNQNSTASLTNKISPTMKAATTAMSKANSPASTNNTRQVGAVHPNSTVVRGILGPNHPSPTRHSANDSGDGEAVMSDGDDGAGGGGGGGERRRRRKGVATGGGVTNATTTAETAAAVAAEKRPRRVELVVKLGGSALTHKSTPHTLDEERLAAAVDTVTQLHERGVGFIVVHGAGSFGHFEARAHRLSAGDATPLGVAATHAAVAALNAHVVHALVARGVPAVGVAPLVVPARTRTDFVAALLDRGHLPVLHGDACYAGDGRTAIISGDALVASLAVAFPFVNRVVFLSDVPGLLRRPPSPRTSPVSPSPSFSPPSSSPPLLSSSSPSLSTGSHSPGRRSAHFPHAEQKHRHHSPLTPQSGGAAPGIGRGGRVKSKAKLKTRGRAQIDDRDVVRCVVVNEMGNIRIRNGEFHHHQQQQQQRHLQHQHQRGAEYGDNGGGVNVIGGESGDEGEVEEEGIETWVAEHDTTGGITGKVVAAARCAADTGGRVTAFIAEVGSEAADTVLFCRPDRAASVTCTRVCFQPDGGMPPLHVDDVLASPPAPPDKKTARVAAALARTSLPKRGSGLTDRSRRRGWFTSTST